MIESALAAALPDDRKAVALDVLQGLPDGDAVCHGDFHPDNVIMSPRGPVVLDWMNAMQGDPLGDVARTSLMLTRAAIPPTMPAKTLMAALRGYLHRVYLSHYQALRPFSPEDLEAWLLPVAAARLREDIPEERQSLLALVDALIAARG